LQAKDLIDFSIVDPQQREPLASVADQLGRPVLLRQQQLLRGTVEVRTVNLCQRLVGRDRREGLVYIQFFDVASDAGDNVRQSTFVVLDVSNGADLGQQWHVAGGNRLHSGKLNSFRSQL